MSEKRQQIKKALGRFRIEVEDAGAPYFALDYDALAENKDVIIIECEVEHGKTKDSDNFTDILAWAYPSPGCSMRQILHSIQGHHGTPGKALAIIISLREE